MFAKTIIEDGSSLTTKWIIIKCMTSEYYCRIASGRIVEMLIVELLMIAWIKIIYFIMIHDRHYISWHISIQSPHTQSHDEIWWKLVTMCRPEPVWPGWDCGHVTGVTVLTHWMLAIFLSLDYRKMNLKIFIFWAITWA